MSVYEDSESEGDSEGTTIEGLQHSMEGMKREEQEAFLRETAYRKTNELRDYIEYFRSLGITFPDEDKLEELYRCDNTKNMPDVWFCVVQYSSFPGDDVRARWIRRTAFDFEDGVDVLVWCNEELKCFNHEIHRKPSVTKA